ncbi:MAG: hypothetical protein WBL95_25310 [Microcoleus sp.]
MRCSGLNVIQASDGVEALDQVSKNYPDLVLLDHENKQPCLPGKVAARKKRTSRKNGRN